jgi:Holliday junction resolvase RusA-like endonuclease
MPPMPFPCRATNMPFWKRPLKAMAGSWQGRGRVTEWEQHVSGMVCVNRHWPSRDGMLATYQRSAYSCYHAEFQEVCYQKRTNLRCRWPVWNKATFVMDEKKLIILVQGYECLYNLQLKDYDNLVKDNYWKEIAGELHAQGKEPSRRAQHCQRMAG